MSQRSTISKIAPPTLLQRPLTLGELTHIVENMEALRSCNDWITNYLAKPHPQLGRSGSVCPFAAPAMTKDTLRIAVVRLAEGIDRKSQIVEAVRQYQDAFLKLSSSEETQILHAIMILFPDVRDHEAAELIDATKEELKGGFIEQGLMLGEFHAKNASPGLHNAAFTPLRSDIPMLAIRRMVSTDYVFLNRLDYDAGTRLRYLERYLNASGIAASSLRRELEQAVASLRAELAAQNV